MPADLVTATVDDSFGEKKVLLRRRSGNAEVTIFQGVMKWSIKAALNWLSSQP